MSNTKYSVIVKNLHKSFKLPHEQHSGIKQLLINTLKRKRGYEVQHVLNDLSFDIKKGEFFGIVGRNGSGKSTLLKILAGIYVPDKGLVNIIGNLTPFIELGVGFNPELTGRENVFLNGALLGFSRTEMEKMYSEIVEFAELKKFMDQKLKNYSSGMQVRLAFSIAIRANTPILLIDEVLAVGDSEFQNKCYVQFRRMKDEGKTIIFVTHDMSAVERFCDRVLVLQHGKIRGIYAPSKAAAIYQRMNVGDAKTKKDVVLNSKRWGRGDVKVEGVEIYDDDKVDDGVFEQGDDLNIKIKLKNQNAPKDVVIGLAFTDVYGVNLSGPNSKGIKLNSSSDIKFVIPRLSFVPGIYRLTVAVFDVNTEIEYDHIETAAQFTVVNNGQEQYGKISLFGKWSQ